MNSFTVTGNLGNSEVGGMYKKSQAKQYEVSVEKNLAGPITFKELQTAMAKKDGQSFDHHSSKTNNPF